MTLKRVLTQYSTEELLESITSTKVEDDSFDYSQMKNDVPHFLATYNIEPGKYTVPQRALYELYRLWSPTPKGMRSFLCQVGRYLLIHYKGQKCFYLINKKALKLTEEAYKFILKRSIDKTKSVSWARHFANFIKKYDIKPGDWWIEGYILYDLYDKYVYEIGRKLPIGFSQFSNFCRLYLTQARLTENRVSWWGVDPSIRKYITDEHIEALRETRNAKKDKEKSRKISRAKARIKSKN